MIKVWTLLLFIGVLNSVTGECPNPDEIPIMYNDDYFTCANFWYGLGAPDPINACNGCETGTSYAVRDGYDISTVNGRHYSMGSIMVKAGCTLYMYLEENYQGDSNNYYGPANIYQNLFGHNSVDDCGIGPTSFQCRCIQKPVTCVPEDRFVVVFSCDNTMGAFAKTCNYDGTIGTRYSDSLASDMRIDATIEEELTSQFFGLFSENLGFSLTTGYDWEHVSDLTMGPLTSKSITAEAPPGYVLVIEQAVGHCDGSIANTELFSISLLSKDGTVVYSTLEKSSQTKKFLRSKNWAQSNNKSDQLPVTSENK